MRRAPWFIALALVVGCSAPALPSPAVSPTILATLPPTNAPTPTPTALPTATSANTAAANLDYLLERLEGTHPDPWHGISREEWVAQMEALKQAVPSLDPYQAYVELARLVAQLSREGRDGHQFAIPRENVEGPALPFRTYEFAEGVYVTAAMPGYELLVGKRIAAVGGHPINDVLAALEPLVPRDGPQTVPGFRTIFMLRLSVLRGLDLVGDGPISLDVVGEDGVQQSVNVEPADWPDWRRWAGEFGIGLPQRDDTLYLSYPGPVLWSEKLADSHALYIRYEGVQSISQRVANMIREQGSGAGVDKVILDLRQNPGGDNHFFPTLLGALRDPGIDQPGRLYVLTDRLTFSAASNFATSLEQQTSAIFAGEPMGGGLNFWDDVQWVELSDWPLPTRVGVSTRYWEFAAPDDPRLTIEPNLALPVSAADYFADHDPVLEAVLAQ